MRWTKTLIPTLKEVPSDAEIPSHQLALRAGLIRQVMAGAYTYLPLGLRVLHKVTNIIREEMNRAEALEIFMPALNPLELFERTGRREAFGKVLINFELHRGGSKVPVALGPTHEEVVTDLVSDLVSSYRQLPFTLYQIQTKFRNEERPRFGVLRTSEFIMKDAYSFSTNVEQLDAAYKAMYNAYCRIYSRCGIDYLPVEAESGPIGGDASHEFMVPSKNGEDIIVFCRKCKYGANTEKAEIGREKETEEQNEERLSLEKVSTPKVSTIDDVSRFLKTDPAQIIKTLIYMIDKEPTAVLLRGDHEANENKIRDATKAESVELANEKTILEITNAPVGFAGPVGLTCKVIADFEVAKIINGVAGGNEQDMHYVNVNFQRDYEVQALFDLRNAEANDPCPRCDGKLELVHGIEVGHVFKLGTKYSIALDAEYLDDKEVRHPVIMGCYGIGVTRMLAALGETHHDENGLIWPITVAPYEVLLIPLNVKDEEVTKAAETIYNELVAAGIDVLMDDRDQRPGFKFKDADLLGIPLRVVVGGKGLKEGMIEVKWRTSAEVEKIAVSSAVSHIVEQVNAEKNKYTQDND